MLRSCAPSLASVTMQQGRPSSPPRSRALGDQSNRIVLLGGPDPTDALWLPWELLKRLMKLFISFQVVIHAILHVRRTFEVHVEGLAASRGDLRELRFLPAHAHPCSTSFNSQGSDTRSPWHLEMERTIISRDDASWFQYVFRICRTLLGTELWTISSLRSEPYSYSPKRRAQQGWKQSYRASSGGAVGGGMPWGDRVVRLSCGATPFLHFH